MTHNAAIGKHNFITNIVLKNGNGDLSKHLKVKIMGMKIGLAKIRREFDEDVQEFIKAVKPEEFDALHAKEDKTEEESAKLAELSLQIDSEYEAFVNSKGLEEVSFDKTISEEEFYEIVEVNSDNNVEINGATIAAPDFLEVLYSLFVA